MKFDYKVGDKVDISALERDGRVIAIHIDEEGVTYKVRYFFEGSIKSEYFYADELEARK